MASLSKFDLIDFIGDQKDSRYIGLELEVVRNNETKTWDELECEINECEEWDDWDECYYMNENELTKVLQEKFMPKENEDKLLLKAGKDGGDIELILNPVSRDIITKWNSCLATTLEKIKKTCMTSDESGIHVHVSKTAKDNKNLMDNLYWFQLVYAEQLYKLFGRKSHWALSPIDSIKDHLFEDTKILHKDNPKVKRRINGGIKGTMFVEREHTYECRGGAGTIEPDKIRQYALLFHNIVSFCNQKSIIGHRFEEIFNYGTPQETYLLNQMKTSLSKTELRQIVPLTIYKK